MNVPFLSIGEDRIGLGYAAFRRGMTAALRREVQGGLPVATGRTGPLPVAAADAATSGPDWTSALIDAWAMIGDILAFYQGRIAAEGFLGTAVEDDSITELLDSIGYQLDPGTAATALVSLALPATPNPDRALVVPRGTRLQTLPEPGQLPMVFETDSDLSALAAWNRIPLIPASPPAPPEVDPNCSALVLSAPQRSIGPGAIIHIGASKGHPASPVDCNVLRTVAGIAALPVKGRPSDTLVSLMPLAAPAPPTPVPDPTISRFGVRTMMFGARAPEWTTLSVAAKARLGRVSGGVSVLATADGAWQGASGGLVAPLSGPIAALRGGGLIAAADSGLMRWSDGLWAPLGPAGPAMSVTALAADPEGTIYCGTATGHVLVSYDEGKSWDDISGRAASERSGFRLPFAKPLPAALPATVIRAIVPGAAILVATDLGIFRSAGPGQGWTAWGDGLPGWDGSVGAPVTAMLTTARGRVFAGTGRGLFTASHDLADWQPVAGAPQVVLDLAESPGGMIVARTATGLIRSDDEGTTWTAAWPDDAAAPPLAIAFAGDWLYAGTKGGLFRSNDKGTTWIAPSTGDTDPIDRLAVAPDGSVVRSSPALVIASNEWPNFQPTPGQIDLGVHLPEIVSGSIVAVLAGDQMGAFTIAAVENVRRQDFGLDRLITRLTVTGDDAIFAAVDLRTAEVLLDSQPLPLATVQANANSAPMLAMTFVPCDSTVPTLPLGRTTIAVGAQASVAHVIRSTTPGVDVTPTSGSTAVELHANVVSVTQRRSITGEVLGSGDAATPHQRFKLATGPLTFVESGEPVIAVKVAGAAWRRVDSLTDCGPDDRAYEVRTNADGTGVVLFGDGIHGARLPTGRENIVASYAVGIGGAAPAPGQLSTLLRAPVRLANAGNPLAGIAGRPREAPADARDAVPRRRCAGGRLVSLQDFRDFAGTFAGVAAASVEMLITPRGPLLAISVASEVGQQALTLDAAAAGDAEVAAALRQAIGALADAAEGVRVRPCVRRTVPFDVDLVPETDGDRVALAVSAREALIARFAGRADGGTEVITAGAVVSALAGISGATRIGLVSIDGIAVADRPWIELARARWDDDAWDVVAAQFAWFPLGVKFAV